MKHEFSSKRLAALAAVGVKHPEKLDLNQVAAICGSVLTQAHNKVETNKSYEQGRAEMAKEILTLLDKNLK